jgi:predicted short-subunit dehydrogenase-like oxidoreductase (DUF2520 family)
MAARGPEKLKDFDQGVPKVSLEGRLAEADIYLMAISDSAIEEVASRLGDRNALIVHTAGGIGLEVFGGMDRAGVLYPLQTFSMHRELDFREIPLCIEARKTSDLNLLRSLAGALSRRVIALDTEQRKHLHLSAVFANNFTNHMVCLGEAICREAGLPKDLLHPLLRETWAKLETLSAYDAQTGPARRADHKTQQQHIALLKDRLHREVYKKISESIQHSYD